MNVLDETTGAELAAIVDATTKDAAIKGVVITSGKDTFSGGADLTMLEGMNRTYVEMLKAKGEEAANKYVFDEVAKLSQNLRKIETSGKPWVAAINGLAFGGAFELTLACHYRVASENPKTRLGLPEIKVGLFPGGGGTQRLPRMIQPMDAMQMLLKGDAIDLKKAQAWGIVGAVVPPAMIENVGKMAGMPVGPLSLNDEIAIDLALKILKATEADIGTQAVDQDQKKLLVEMVEKRGRLGRKNGKGFYDYPEKGKGQKKLWPELSTLQPKHLDPDTLDIEELKQRFLVVQAVEAARTVEDHVITDPREADVGSILGFGFAPFTGGTLSYIDFMGTKNFVELCHKLEKKYGSRFTPPKLLVDMAAKGETFYGRFPPKKLAA
jgi:enoyl-CoA hydratase/carnithine racemase